MKKIINLFLLVLLLTLLSTPVFADPEYIDEPETINIVMENV